MYQRQLFKWVSLIVVLLLAGMACNLGGGDGTETPSSEEGEVTEGETRASTSEPASEPATEGQLPTSTPRPTVPAGSATLTLDKTTFAPGEQIQVHFTAPDTFPDDAWVGIIPSSVAHGSEAENDEYDEDYRYLEGEVEGVFEFIAPLVPGSYDFRMHDTDYEGLEVAFTTFHVSGD